MTARPAPLPFTVSSDDVPYDQVDALLRGTLVAPAGAIEIQLHGSGAVACMQGLLTNDLENPGEGALVYGAVLTPKGMIVCDLWAERYATMVSLAVPAGGADALWEILTRSVPPRLARMTRLPEDDHRLLRLAGPASVDAASAAGFEVPAPGRTSGLGDTVGGRLARTAAGVPFALQFAVGREAAEGVLRDLESAGTVVASPGALELARILAGWPRLGAEIDDKTLPQEVRFDQIGGVSYTKGCYTGQETVARVHFRGHPNREMVGLTWRDTPDLEDPGVVQDGRQIGRVTSVAWLAPLERYIGLAIVRREVDRADLVTAAGTPARVTELPFTIDG